MGMFTDAARYDRHAGQLGRRIYQRVVADAVAAGLPAGTRVLDVGTGPGRVPRALAAAQPTWQIEAMDVEPNMIEYARRQDPDGRVIFTVGDVAALPYPDAGFDLIVSSLSQHHWSDVPAGIRELRRVLRPDGLLWIYDLRFALRKATRTAETVFAQVRRDPVPLTKSTWPFSLMARLCATGLVRSTEQPQLAER
nr:class I SAM-dependent methyltransferase [uncultured Actinoplanes sp.]